MYNQPFALITGASEGLGKYLALECAGRKLNLVLVALPGSRLHQLAGYIRSNYGVQVVPIEKDLSLEESCIAVYNEVKNGGITISILINNAGMGGTFFFDERSTDYYSRLISLNVTAPTILTRLFLPDLKKSAPSFILNVSSIAGIFHPPKKGVYSGTKSYLMAFSKSLRRELKGENVSVSVLCPGGMNTTWQLMVQHRTTGNWLSRNSVTDPHYVASIAISGMFEKKELIVPGFLNKCFLFSNALFPKRIKDFLTHYFIRKATGSTFGHTSTLLSVPISNENQSDATYNKFYPKNIPSPAGLTLSYRK